MSKKVFAFDLGKASVGYCVREGFDIRKVGSIIIEKDHAEITTNRDRRRVKKTLEAHKAREQFFKKLWQNAGLETLDKEDERFKKEFGNKKDKNIYTSCLLRIALLQNKKLEQWQIYKALFNAFQRRGYDANLAWANAKTDDDKKNAEYMAKYTKENNVELINNDDFKFPCYYDAKRLGLWSEENPSELKTTIPLTGSKKVRTNGLVAPRELVEKELKQLWLNAQKQLPQLQNIDAEYFLYGDYRQAYGSYVVKEFRKFRGTKNDWQGVLGQKIPRFDNRIIAKCKLLPKRNVCKANTLENVSLVLLMKLKNLRLTDNMGEKFLLSPIDIKKIYENWLIKAKIDTNEEKLDTTITKKEIETVLNRKIKDKINPMKANISGRSSFCRRACKIMTKIILSCELYPQNVDITEFVDKPNTQNPITIEEINTMISKIGDWNNLYIPDNRDEMAENSSDNREQIDTLIGDITNPIVRNRLQIFRDLILNLKQEYGTPNEVIFEFVRDGADNSLFGAKKANDTLKVMKENEKDNEQIVSELKDANALSSENILKLKLLKKQGLKCIYSGKSIAISNFDACEIDHIYPRSMGGNDALYNKVLCYSMENQKKAGRTPYEWLHKDEKTWFDFVNRLEAIKDTLGKKKYELLTSKPEDCKILIDSYNGLAETAQIARIAQQITALVFNWGLQVEGENRHIFVNNGSSTASIRRTYKLNKLLGDDVKKNRDNDKHHALDAICISFSRDYKYNKEKKVDEIEGLNPEIIKEAINNLMPYPYANDKTFKGNIKPLESIYGKRVKNGNTYLTKRADITSLEPKEKKINNILDDDIRKDLLNHINNKPTNQEWNELLANYTHPKKKTHVKKILMIEAKGQIELDKNERERMGEYVDFGTKSVKNQFKHSKGHKGQILYFDPKNAVKVMPIYANKKTQDVKDKLIDMGCKLYNKGEMFYSGCLVEIPEDFEANVYSLIVDENGKEKKVSSKSIVSKGIFKLRTIKSNGGILIENNSGIEILTSINNLVYLHFRKYKNEK